MRSILLPCQSLHHSAYKPEIRDKTPTYAIAASSTGTIIGSFVEAGKTSADLRHPPVAGKPGGEIGKENRLADPSRLKPFDEAVSSSWYFCRPYDEAQAKLASLSG
jgi:hypothetical protein